MIQHRNLQLPGVALDLELCPNNPAAVFMHGFGSDKRTWDPLWTQLPPGSIGARFDLRGFGRSLPRTEEPFGHADDLLSLLDALDIEKADLVGVSMGGGVAINFALGRPDRIRSLAVINPALLTWNWSAQWVALWKPIVAAARAGDMGAARDLWTVHPLFERTLASEAAGILMAEIGRFSGQPWVDDRQARVPPDLDRLHELRAPVLLLTGADDLPDFRSIAAEIEARTADVTRHDKDGAGHLLHLEAPKWCADRLRAFWNGLAGRQHCL